MRHGPGTPVRMPTGMYGMLPAAGLCVSDGGGSGADGGVHRHDCRGLREALRLPHGASDAAEGAARGLLPVFRGERLLDPSSQADAVPHIPVLAGAGGKPAGVEEDGALLPWDRAGTADSNRERESASGRDAPPVA